ncbi:hypothetical protein GN244_ATG12798 [Phytophthora infestans]|uniref:M96 mating-specific protein family n=1 Tax=Phytophthora infestans TaxID=4787 RepID=A0A833WAM5_PHYIN|nr:hypothetical protein GN244_ATG12798 [Phytophthora infestans]
MLSTPPIGKLEEEAAMLYRDLTSQLLVGSPARVSMSLKTKSDSIHGEIVEMMSTIPLPCSVDSASQLVWGDLTANIALVQRLKGRQPNSYVKNWVINVEGALEQKPIKGPERVVIVKSGVITLPNEGLQFRDQCWMIITSSETSRNASVIPCCGRIFLDTFGASSGFEGESFERNLAALKHLGFKLREKAQLLQNRLIDEAESANRSS